MKSIIDKLKSDKNLSDKELKNLIDTDDNDYLFTTADGVRRQVYGDSVYVRGLIEISNHCKNNCFYCGLRGGNKLLNRYRLSEDDIINCADEGYKLGIRTFVLQGGEDLSITDKDICSIVSHLKTKHPDCAITLSIGEKSRESYKLYKAAGTDRYLLRHEAADKKLYSLLHPDNMSIDRRKRCLWDLKELGFQVGAGFMVGAPYQTLDHLVSDIRFMIELEPDMIGIGPFLPHSSTPFANEAKGSMKQCLNLISILRLIFPHALIPSTTALATIHPQGRELGLKAGANVLMPNLSPAILRKLYSLYNDKACTDKEAAENIKDIQTDVEKIGYHLVIDRGDVKRVCY